MAAAGHGNTTIIEELLRKGANISLTATMGWSAIQFAQSQNQKETLEILNEKSQKILENYHKNFNDELIDFRLLKNLVKKLHRSS